MERTSSSRRGTFVITATATQARTPAEEPRVRTMQWLTALAGLNLAAPASGGRGLPPLRREDDERESTLGAPLISRPGRVIPGRLRPQALAFPVACFARAP